MKFATPLACPSCGTLFQASGVEIETCPICAYCSAGDSFPRAPTVAGSPIKLIRRDVSAHRDKPVTQPKITHLTPTDHNTAPQQKSPLTERPLPGFGAKHQATATPPPQPEDPLSWLEPEPHTVPESPHVQTPPPISAQPASKPATAFARTPPATLPTEAPLVPTIPPVSFASAFPGIDATATPDPLDPSIFSAPFADNFNDEPEEATSQHEISFDTDAKPNPTPKWVIWLLIHVGTLGTLTLGILKHTNKSNNQNLQQGSLLDQIRQENKMAAGLANPAKPTNPIETSMEASLLAMRSSARQNLVQQAIETQVRDYVESPNAASLLQRTYDQKLWAEVINFDYTEKKQALKVTNFKDQDLIPGPNNSFISMSFVKTDQNDTWQPIMGVELGQKDTPEFQFFWPVWKDARDSIWKNLCDSDKKVNEPHTVNLFCHRLFQADRPSLPFGPETIAIRASVNLESDSFYSIIYADPSRAYPTKSPSVLTSGMIVIGKVDIVWKTPQDKDPFWELIDLSTGIPNLRNHFPPPTPQ